MNAFLNIIPTVILVLTDIDKITWNYVPWGALAGNAILSLLFNFLVNFGIALLNPLLISVGMLCGIPVSAIIDILFRNLEVTPKFIIGSFLILISFVLAAFPLRDICLRITKRSKTSYNVTTTIDSP
uniref:Uncharacterized protein n=1 Tax=Panagrolaimus davidi TaxID=227884 RepID=A0A914PLM7_9BILA